MKTKFDIFLRLLIFAALVCGGRLLCAQDLDSARQISITGAATDGSLQLTLSLGVNDDPANRVMNATVDSTGNFTVPVKLFPGTNTIDITGDTNEEEHTVVINVQAPAIRVELSWAGEHQDYDLYVNNVCYYNKNADGGVLDRDWIDQADPATENITFSQADAGLYHVFVNYYRPHTVDGNGNPVNNPTTGEPVPNPQATTVKVFVNEQQVYTDTQTITEPEGGIQDGKGTWAVCTLVVHSGTESGGFQVDDQGFRDIVPQKTILDRIDPRTPYSIDSLTGPSNDDIVFFPVGKSIQVNASGSINVGTDNEQGGIDIIGHFQTTDASVADVDDLGVITGLTPGVVTISAQSDNPGGGGAQAQAVTPTPNAPATQKQYAPTEVDFGKNGASNGFDAGPNPPWIMVPLPGTATADNTVIKPDQAAAGRVGFASFSVAVATVAPTTASTSPQPVTVTGVKAGNTTIQAKLKSSDGTLGDTLGQMIASVKPKITRTVAIHQVLLPGQPAMTNLPSNQALANYLNNTVYGIQCNVYFNVVRSDVTVNYDTVNPPDQKLLIVPSPNFLGQEELAAANAVASATPAPPAADINIYFVYDVICTTDPTLVGYCHGQADKAFIKVAASASTDFVNFACAHEMGHTEKNGLLRDLSKKDTAATDPNPSGGGDITKRLMFHDGNSPYPTFINKTEWNKVNLVKP